MKTNNDPMYFFKFELKNKDSLNKIRYSGNRIKTNDPYTVIKGENSIFIKDEVDTKTFAIIEQIKIITNPINNRFIFLPF